MQNDKLTPVQNNTQYKKRNIIDIIHKAAEKYQLKTNTRTQSSDRVRVCWKMNKQTKQNNDEIHNAIEEVSRII